MVILFDYAFRHEQEEDIEFACTGLKSTINEGGTLMRKLIISLPAVLATILTIAASSTTTVAYGQDYKEKKTQQQMMKEEEDDQQR